MCIVPEWLLIEASCSDLSALVEEVDTEKLALAAGLVPCLDIRLHADTSFDCPFVCVGRKRFDGVYGTVAMGCTGRCGGARWEGLLYLGLGIFSLDTVESSSTNCSRLGAGIRLLIERGGFTKFVVDREARDDFNVEDDQNTGQG